MASAGIETDVFGTTSDGQQVVRYTLRNKNNVTVQILNYGGIITSINVPDKAGQLADVTTGFSSVSEYEANPAFFGALVGRIANRIDGGKFTLDGQKYFLAVNRAPNHLHGGNVGFDKKIWSSRVEGSQLKLSYSSADHEEGYPGCLTVEVIYELTDDNEILINYTATTDKPTIVNLTNHAYFNLAGHKAKSIFDHSITVNAEKYLEKADGGCPNGVIASVADTLFDLRKPTLLGDRVEKIPGQLPGYDHNFCLEGTGRTLAVRLEHIVSGRVLEVYTDQPGIQVYTGNYISDLAGKDGAVYGQYAAVALEAQNYPDAINHANFPSCVLRPGETYRQNTSYKFLIN